MFVMFEELLWKKLIIWIDDLFGFATSIEDWYNTLDRVLEIAEAFGLKFNIDKCDLFLKEAKFAGRIFNEHGVKHDPARIQAMLDISHPVTARDLQQFLYGSQWMSRHIAGYNKHVEPLQDISSIANKSIRILKAFVRLYKHVFRHFQQFIGFLRNPKDFLTIAQEL